jgi:hypothetical protein
MLQPKQNRFCALASSDLSDDELEFMKAIDAFKRQSGKAHPTWAEVLAVTRALGYRKIAAPELPGKRKPRAAEAKAL